MAAASQAQREWVQRVLGAKLAAGVGVGQVTPPTAAPLAAAPPPPPPPAPKPAAAQPNADALGKELAALIRRIPEAAGADPALKAQLAKFATDANVNLKTNNLRTAAGLVAQLRETLRDALDAAGVEIGQVTPPTAQAAPDGAAQAAQAAAAAAAAAAAENPVQAWLDAKDAANAQIGKLQDALREMNHPVFQRLAEHGLSGIAGRLQVGLQVALMEVQRANDETREKAQEKARSVIADFRSFLATDAVLPILEENPLGVPITLRTDLKQTLDAIDNVLAA